MIISLLTSARPTNIQCSRDSSFNGYLQPQDNDRPQD